MNRRSVTLLWIAMGALLLILPCGCEQQSVYQEPQKTTKKINYVQKPVTPTPRPTPDKKVAAANKQMREIGEKMEAISQDQRRRAYPEAAVPVPVVRVDFVNGKMFLDGKSIDHTKYVDKRLHELEQQRPALAVIADENGDYYNTIMTLLGYCKTHCVSDIRFGGELFRDVSWNKPKP